ncbi:MAG: tetratricopeptide repeat protein [Myxococcales bacterium]
MAEERPLPAALSQHLRLDDDDGPAVPLDGAATDALIGSALERWEAGASVTPIRKRPGRRGAPLLIAAMVLGIGSAAAMYLARPTPPPAPEPATGTESGAVTEIEAESESEPEAVTETEAVTEPEAVTETETVTETEAEPAPRPEDILARANRLRGEGRYRDAERAYLRAVRRAPGSPVAHVARVAAADLRRERLGDPRGALQLYRRALGAGGALAVEAHRGVALSQRALGHHDGERRALQALLEAQPDGAHARWARRRLAELDATTP